jgi:hypothetical protein
VFTLGSHTRVSVDLISRICLASGGRSLRDSHVTTKRIFSAHAFEVGLLQARPLFKTTVRRKVRYIYLILDRATQNMIESYVVKLLWQTREIPPVGIVYVCIEQVLTMTTS